MSSKIEELLYSPLYMGVRNPYEVRLEDLFSPPIIYQSIQECKRGKLWKDSVILSDYYSNYVINDIMTDMLNYTFAFHPLYHTYINERGKDRLICSLDIRDRIVQKILNQGFLLPIFRSKFIYDNGASLTNRGIHFSADRLETKLHREFRNHGYDFYIAKFDISSFFDNIPHNYVLNEISKYCNDVRIMALFNQIMYMYKYDEYIHDGLHVDAGIGLGGEVPQSFGIICLNELDHIITENSLIKADEYIRYMDDFIVIDHNLDKINNIIYYITSYLNSIGLSLNQNKTRVNSAREGVKFLKIHYFITETGGIIRKPDPDSYKKMRRKINKYGTLYNKELMTEADIDNSVQSFVGYKETICDSHYKNRFLCSITYNGILQNTANGGLEDI